MLAGLIYCVKNILNLEQTAKFVEATAGPEAIQIRTIVFNINNFCSTFKINNQRNE